MSLQLFEGEFCGISFVGFEAGLRGYWFCLVSTWLGLLVRSWSLSLLPFDHASRVKISNLIRFSSCR